MGRPRTKSLEKSHTAAHFSWGIEIECILPQSWMLEVGLYVGGYHELENYCPTPLFPPHWRCESDSSLRGSGLISAAATQSYDTRQITMLGNGLVPETARWTTGERVCNCAECRHFRVSYPLAFRNSFTARGRRVLSTTRAEVPSEVPCEIISPVLSGLEGIRQVKEVLDLIKSVGGYTNETCGQHIHIGIESVTGKGWQNCQDFIASMLQNTASHERALWAVNGDCRRENSRTYARSIKGDNEYKAVKQKLSQLDRLKKFAPALAQNFNTSAIIPDVRNSALGLSSLHRYGTLEFRVFDGTVDSDVALGRIQMVLALAEKSLRTCRASWGALASAKTYPGKYRGVRNLERFFILMGWTGGKYLVDKVPTACGWIMNTKEDLDRIKAALRKQAAAYDEKNPQGANNE